MSARIETLIGKDESGTTYTLLPRTSTKAIMDESGNTADELITDLSQEVSELINDVDELSGKVETLSGEVVTHEEKLSELDVDVKDALSQLTGEKDIQDNYSISNDKSWFLELDVSISKGTEFNITLIDIESAILGKVGLYYNDKETRLDGFSPNSKTSFTAPNDINKLFVYIAYNIIAKEADVSLLVNYNLQDSIKLRLDEATEKADRIKEISGINRLDEKTIVDGYIRNSNGDIAITGDWKTTDYIDVHDIDNIVFSAVDKTSGNRGAETIYYMLGYDANKTPIASSYKTNAGSTTNVNSIQYIRFAYHSSLLEKLQLESGTIPTEYEPYYKVVILEDSDYVHYKEVKESISKSKEINNVQGKNLVDTSALSEGYIKNDAGEIEIFGDWKTTDFIYVHSISNVVFSAKDVSTQLRNKEDVKFYLGYDAQKKPIISTYATTKNSVIAIEPNVHYIRFAYHSQLLDDIQLEVGDINTSYEPFRINTIFTFSPYSIQKKWEDKTWAVIGDSMTENNIRATKRYHDYISEATGIRVLNKGVSGTGYARTENQFYKRIGSIPNNVDVITIMGSGNDAGAGIPIGEPTDMELNSICGYVNKAISEVQRLFPLTPFGIITTLPHMGGEPDEDTSDSRWYDSYILAIKTICLRRGVPFIDIFHQSNLHPSSAEFRSIAYTRDEGNGTHPDENGHKVIAPRIKSFIETLIL